MNEPIVNVVGAKFVTSAVQKDQYPALELSEIVFAGRSNVGKSSLINSLTNHRGLAQVSGTPGRTRTVNFFEVGLKRGDARQKFYLVDLPGYGYAKTGKANLKEWSKFTEEYLTSSKRIKFVVLLLDIRRDLTNLDANMFAWLLSHNLPVLPVVTKSDKLGKQAGKKQTEAIKTALAEKNNINPQELDILAYSSLKNEGRSDLLDTIFRSLL